MTDRLMTVDSFLPVREELKKNKKLLVWTNGCFDLLHEGHVVYLQNAKALGDVLLVGINSDASFQAWKKRPGPINHHHQRARVLLALRPVDYVIIFDSPSPAGLLKKIQPDIYVKGNDYTLETIDVDERAVVEAYGGRIAFCEGVPGQSTSKIISRIINLYKNCEFS